MATFTAPNEALYHGVGGSEVCEYTPVEIGELKLGDMPGQAEPSPKRLSWKKKNRVVTHEIPGAKDKTQRTSVETLWTLTLTVRTMKVGSRMLIKQMANEVGPFLVVEGFQSMQMYLIDVESTRIEGEDQLVYEHSMSLIECND